LKKEIFFICSSPWPLTLRDLYPKRGKYRETGENNIMKTSYFVVVTKYVLVQQSKKHGKTESYK
jgi:hypothetical protein